MFLKQLLSERMGNMDGMELFSTGDEPYEMPQTEGEEPSVEPTTGWAAKTPSRLEQLQFLIPRASLSPKEKVAVTGRLEGMTLEEIGQKCGTSRNNIYLILRKAVYKLKKANDRAKTLGI